MSRDCDDRQLTEFKATREVLVSFGANTAQADRWFDTVDRFAHVDLRHGVHYRVVFPDHAGSTLISRLKALLELGANVRAVAGASLNAMVIDGMRAVLPMTREPSAVSTVSNESVVTVAIGTFERLWLNGTPLAEPDMPDDPELTTRERTVLNLLAAGYADSSIAVRTGVSVRTVRRTISEVMDRLDARSRFQAGARAARLGWLGSAPRNFEFPGHGPVGIRQS